MDAKLSVKYPNKWVALTSDRKKVVAWARDIKSLDKKVEKMIDKEVVYHHVLPSNGSYAPSCLK